MILGDMVMESTRFGPDSACKAREGEDLSDQLANAIQFLQPRSSPTSWRSWTRRKIAPSLPTPQ